MDVRGASGADNEPSAASEPRGLVGRQRELSELNGVVAEMSEGRAAVALIEGEAGIGKSRLLAEVVRHTQGRGLAVLCGRAHELEWDRPFGTVADALGLRADATDPEQAEIARLLYADASEPAASPLLAQAPQLRFRLVEAVVARIERLATARPLVLALEDLHWADPSTLLVIQHLSRRLRHLPIALLATLRLSPRSPELNQLIDELMRGQAISMALGQLDAPEVATLVEQTVGAPPGPRLCAQVERTGGNPLFVTELVAALRQEAAIVITDGVAEVQPATLPPSLRATILRRLSSLPAESLEALRIASVLGTSFSLDDLSVVLVTPSVELLSVLGEPLRAGLIGETGEHMAFRHALVRDAIYADLPRSACRALHAQVARSLGAAERAPSEVARHFLLGAHPGDADAVSWLLRAARETVSRAPGTAVELYEAAVRLAGDASPERDTLHAELGVALMWSGQPDEGQARLSELLDRPHDRAIDASTRLALAQALLLQGRAQAAVKLLEEAAAHPASGAPPQLLAEVALARLARGEIDAAAVGAERAGMAGRERGDDPAICVSLCVQAAVVGLRGRASEALALALAEGALQVATSSAIRETSRHPPQFFVGALLVDLDRLEEAQRMLQTARRVGEDFGTAWHLPLFHLLCGLVHFHRGDHDDAVAEVEAALVLTEEVGTRINVLWARALLAHVLLHRGDVQAAQQAVEAGEREMADLGPQVRGADWLVWARALLEDASGRTEVALALLQAIWDAHGELGIVVERRLIGPDLVRLCMAQDDVDTAGAVADAVAEAAELNGSASARGAALRCQGLARGDAELLRASVEAYRCAPRRMEYGFACEDAGTALSRAGRRDEAHRLLQEALAVFESSGALRPLRRTEAALRDGGARRGKRGTRARPVTGWDALTTTELTVTRLAGAGLTNPEIGERLFISRRTVETHLSHVFAKLGVASRVTLATMVATKAPR